MKLMKMISRQLNQGTFSEFPKSIRQIVWVTQICDHLWMLSTELKYGVIFWILEFWIFKMAKTVPNIFDWSPTHFVSNSRHQHPCNLFLKDKNEIFWKTQV